MTPSLRGKSDSWGSTYHVCIQLIAEPEDFGQSILGEGKTAKMDKHGRFQLGNMNS